MIFYEKCHSIKMSDHGKRSNSRDLPEMMCVVSQVCRGEIFNFLKTSRLTSIAKINMNNVMQPSVLVSSHSVFKTSIGA